MAVSRIELTAGAFKNSRAVLEQLNMQLKNQLKDLTVTEQSLMGMWTGEAAKTFDRAFQEKGASFEKFTELVGKYAGALDEILRLYDKSEQMNIQTAKQL